MGTKWRRKLVSYIATIAMLLSVFNIPILGYATTSEGVEATAVDTSEFVVQMHDDSIEEYVAIPEDGVEVGGGSYSQEYKFTYAGNEEGEFPDGTLVVQSSDPSVVKIGPYDHETKEYGEYTGNASLNVGSGYSTSQYCSFWYDSIGEAEITVSFVDPEGTENVVKSFMIYVIEDDEGEGSGSVIDMSGGEDEEGSSVDFYAVYVQEGKDYNKWDWIYIDHETNTGYIKVLPYDTSQDIFLAVDDASGETIHTEDIVFEDGEWSTTVDIEGEEYTINVESPGDVWSYVSAGYYDHRDDYVQEDRWFDSYTEDGETFIETWFSIPEGYDSENGIDLWITNSDGTIEELDSEGIVWKEDDDGYIWGQLDTIGVVEGETTDITICFDFYTPDDEEDDGFYFSEDVFATYTPEGEDSVNWDWINVDAETKTGETMIFPYDPDEGVYVTVDNEYGEEIQREEVVFEDGIGTVTVLLNGPEGEEEYTIYVYEPQGTYSYVTAGYYYYGEYIKQYSWFDEGYDVGFGLPFGYDAEYGIDIAVCDQDGNEESLNYEDIVWEEHEDMVEGYLSATTTVEGEDREIGVYFHLYENIMDEGFSVRYWDDWAAEAYEIWYDETLWIDEYNEDLAFDYDGTPYYEFDVIYGDGYAAVPEGTIKITTSDIDVAAISSYEWYEDELWYVDERVTYATIPVSGEYSGEYFDVLFMGNGTADITVIYEDLEGNEEILAEFTVKVEGLDLSDASIDYVNISYVLAGSSKEGMEDEICISENSTTAEYELYPYNSKMPIVVSGVTADGTPFEKKVSMKNGVGTVKIASTSRNGENTINYVIKIVKPTKPMVVMNYTYDGEPFSDIQDFYYDHYTKAYIPYSAEDVTFDVTYPDGTVKKDVDVVWDDDRIGMITIKQGSENFSVKVIKDLASSYASCDVYIDAYDEEENGFGFMLDLEEAATPEGSVVTLPYGTVESMIYVYSWNNTEIEGYDPYIDEEGDECGEPVEAGQTKVITATAEDGTEYTYTFKFVASDGTDTSVDVYTEYVDLNRVDEENLEDPDYYSWQFIDFEEVDGKMVADVTLPYQVYTDEESEYSVLVGCDYNDYVSVDFGNGEDFEYGEVYLDEYGKGICEFTVTSANGEVSQDYVINFATEEDGSAVDVRDMILYYWDDYDEYYEIPVSMEEAASEEGATIVLPKEVKYYDPTLEVTSGGFTYLYAEDNYMGYGDLDLLGIGFDFGKENSATAEVFARSSDGKNTVKYKVTAHIHTEVIDKAVAATLTSNGKTEGMHCSECGEVLVAQETITAIDTVELDKTELAATGAVQTPAVTVTDKDGNVISEEYYTVKNDTNCKNPGTHKITVTFKGKYSGKKTMAFEIYLEAPETVTAQLSGKYNTAKVSWDKVPGATGYYVYYKKATATKWTEGTRTTKLTYSKSSLSAGTEYDFKVVPYYKTSSGKYVKSENYKEAQVTTLRALTAPEVSDSEDTAKVVVSWSGDEQYELAGYEVSKSTSSTGTSVVYETASSEETGAEIEATKGRPYYYKVRGYILVNEAKIYTPWSKTFKFNNHLAAPETVAAELSGSYNKAKITWDKVDGATGYYVYYKKATATKWTEGTRTTKLTYSKSSLSAGTTYDFKVVPYLEVSSKKYEKSENYEEVQIATMKALDAPSVVVDETDEAKVVVEWTPDEQFEFAGYEVSKSTSSSKTEKVYETVTAEEVNALLEATKGRPYYYKVRGYILVNEAKIYTPWSKTTKYINPLDAPEDVKAELYGYNDVKVSWTKTPEATGYYVYYKKVTGTKWTQGARTTKTYANIKDLTSGTEFEFKVVPYYKKSSSSTYHKSERFALTNAVTMKKLATPVVGKDADIDGNVLVTWKLTGPADAYEISRATSSSKTSVVATVEGGELTSASIEGATKGKKYYYKVRAIKYVDGTAIKAPWSSTKAYTYK